MKKNIIAIIISIIVSLFSTQASAEEYKIFSCNSITHCVLEKTKKHDIEKDLELSSWQEQLLPIAIAIDSVIRNNQEKAMLITLGEFESRFARYVLENRCSDGPRKNAECDFGRAKGPWQQWSFPKRQVPDDFNGQADSAIRLLRGFHTKCNGWEGAFAAYATGGNCKWGGAKKRVTRFYTILAKIEQQEAQRHKEFMEHIKLIDKIKELRENTGYSLNECKKALEKSGGSVQDAEVYLKGYIEKNSSKTKNNDVREGRVHTYIHNGGQIASMVEINCETDFASRSKEFENFCENVCMQIVAMQPMYIYKNEISDEQVDLQKEYIRKALNDTLDKPPEIIEKILEEKMKNWYKECVLTEQTSILDQSKTIAELLNSISAKLSENIVISRMERWSIH